jgi:phage gp36-like protein
MGGRYIDWSDVVNRYADVAKDGVDSQRADYNIADAEGEVDSRLAPRYTVPFGGSSTAPQMVRTLAVDLTYWRFIWASDRADKLKEYIDARFDSLVCGSMSLVSSGVILSDNVVQAWSNTEYRSAFGPDDPINWSVSSAAQYDAQQERDFD